MRKHVSINTAAGCLNAPIIFLNFLLLTPVLPPTEASTWARRVVGICITSIPRRYTEATKPARSVVMPPPKETINESLENFKSINFSIIF